MLARLAVAAACLALALASPVAAQDAPPAQAAPPAHQPTLMERAVNVVPVSGWNIYGPGQTNSIVDSSVQGAHAVRVNVTQAGADPWTVGAGSTTIKPIAAGDVLLLAVWLRAERLPEGRATASLNIGLQANAAPYTPMKVEPVEVTGEWKLYMMQVDAPQAYPAGGAGASVHLSTASQTIDLGPVFILDYGQGYDKSRLPRN